MTNFWIMIWAMASGVAKLPEMIFFSFGALTTGVFRAFPIASLTGVSKVMMFFHNYFGRNDFEGFDNFLTNFSHGVPAFRTHQILPL